MEKNTGYSGIHRCIYCGSIGPFDEEHTLPRCLGEFKNSPKLNNRVCRNCNGQIGRESEEQFCRSGPEAFFRNFFNVQGRKSHEPVNLFERGSAGGKAIDIVAPHPETGINVLYEKDPGSNTVRELRQIVVVAADGSSYPIRISKWMTTTEDLAKEIRKLKLEKIVRIHSFASSEELAWVRSLTDGLAEKHTWSEQPEGSVIPQSEIRFEVPAAYFRAVAKASFHYFLAVEDSVRGDEPIFADIRNFILAGEDEKKFVIQERGPIISFPKPKIIHEHWGYCLKSHGHIIVVDCKNGELFGRIQYFVSSDIEPSIYRINISKEVGTLVRPLAKGHFFAYYPDGPKDGYHGELSELTPMQELR